MRHLRRKSNASLGGHFQDMFPWQLLDSPSLTQGQKRTSPLSRDIHPERPALPPGPSQPTWHPSSTHSTRPGLLPLPTQSMLNQHSTPATHFPYRAWPWGTWPLRIAFPGRLGSGGPNVCSSLSLSSARPISVSEFCMALPISVPELCTELPMSATEPYTKLPGLHRSAHVSPRALHLPSSGFSFTVCLRARLQLHQAGLVCPSWV